MRIEPFKFSPFSDRQLQVLRWWTESSPYRDCDGIIADGAIRSGKTLSMSISFVMWAMDTFEGQQFGLCGKSIGSLRRNVINPLIQVLPTLGYRVNERRMDNLLIISKGGRSNRFYEFGGKDESSQSIIQGITLAGILLDEVALMPESFVNQATSRCSVEGSKMFFNCNPSHRMHFFKLNWINQYMQKRLLYLHFTMDDNLSLSETIKQRYENMYAGVFYRRYIEGRWVAAEGAIYDMWSADENSYTQTDETEERFKSARRYVTIDYGTANPMVFLDAMDDGISFWIRKEYYYDSRKDMTRASKTNSEYADEFEKFVDYDHGITVIIDPSALSFKAELRARGYSVKDARNDVLDGIRLTAAFIKKRRLKICRGKCPNFEREIESYVWSNKALEHGEEAPVKENDHAMDAMRYLIKTVASKWRISM